MRLDKYLARCGLGSRKEVKALIQKNIVTINQQVVKKSDTILVSDDIVRVDGNRIDYQNYYYYMMNKPKNYICSNQDELYPSVLNLIEHHSNQPLFCVGRLDVDTTGLLLVTNDGQFSHLVSHGKKNIMKTYEVTLKDKFDQKWIPILEEGIQIHDYICAGAFVEVIKQNMIHLGIMEGKYHQVKKMMHAINNEVISLRRISIGNLKLDSELNEGDYRPINQNEINMILKEDNK